MNHFLRMAGFYLCLSWIFLSGNSIAQSQINGMNPGAEPRTRIPPRGGELNPERLKPDPSPDPLISEMLSYVSKDSLTSEIQGLVNLGTRYMYADNRRQVAEYIVSRFKAHGITDAVVDSFRMRGETVAHDSVWQYNVIATIQGTSDPGQIYLYGAHHDDYSSGDKYHYAPGADDNGSGCAAAIEMARIMKLKGYQPSSTIRLMTFAGEELMGTNKMSGAIYQAGKSAGNHENIALMVCDDMIANTPEAPDSINGTYLAGTFCQWAGELAKSCVKTYTTLKMQEIPWAEADAERFYQLGYPVTGFEEYGMSSTYHTVHDSVSNCNMDFCVEAVKATFAILLSEQILPVPKNIRMVYGRKDLELRWDTIRNPSVNGIRIYRSFNADSAYTLISETAATATFYKDSAVTSGRIYYYKLTSVDEQGNESTPVSVSGCLMPMNRNMLVIRDAPSGYMNPPDSAVFAFYSQVFSGLPYDFTDASATEKDSLDLMLLGKYHQVFWLSNAWSNTAYSAFTHHREDVKKYLVNGGNLFLSNFLPSYVIANNTQTQAGFDQFSDIRKYFRIKNVERKVTAALNAADAAAPGYDTLKVDSVKCFWNPKGHIINVECITPDSGAKIIYRFGSAYDTSTNQGKMKGKPVGIEYLGTDYKLVILDVPLYYLDSSDARKIIRYITFEKFSYPEGTEPRELTDPAKAWIRVYPNPGRGDITLEYYLPYRTPASVSIYDLYGRTVFRHNEGSPDRGTHLIRISTGTFRPGIYLVSLQTSDGRKTIRMIVNGEE